MLEPLLPQILHAIDQVAHRIYKLLVVVLPVGSNQAAIGELARLTGFCRVNVNLEFSRKLLEIPNSDRGKQAPNLLKASVEEGDPKGVILERLELLFEKSLELNPINRLKELARYRTVIALWEGKFQDGRLVYAEFGHPEYRSYRPDEINDIMVIG
jgi:hypothetical protein